MDIVSLLMRWMHVLSAIALMGGTIFMRFALHPALATLDTEQQKALKGAVRRHWAKWVMASSGFLLVSGIVNFVLYIKAKEIDPPYHAVIGIKMLLALAIMFIASLLVGRSANAEKFRQDAVKWLNVNLVLAVIVVCIGGYLRTLHTAKSADAEPEKSKVTARAE
jgi:uncharacterized membrane protein